jgi:hypothetical protein
VLVDVPRLVGRVSCFLGNYVKLFLTQALHTRSIISSVECYARFVQRVDALNFVVKF